MFESEIELTMVGLDVTHEAIVGPERVERFARWVIGKVVAEWPTSTRPTTARRTGGTYTVHDALAVASVICPELLEPLTAGSSSRPNPSCAAAGLVVDLYPRGPSPPNAHVAVGVDAAAFLDLLEERISRLT